MNLSEQEKNILFAQVGESPVAILILEEAKKIYDDKTQEVVMHGKISDEDFKKDFRYLLGMAATAKAIINRVNEAKAKSQTQ